MLGFIMKLTAKDLQLSFCLVLHSILACGMTSSNISPNDFKSLVMIFVVLVNPVFQQRMNIPMWRI